MVHVKGIWILLVALAALPIGETTAQQGTSGIQGRIVDRITRAPLEGALVFVLGRQIPVASDGEGRFRYAGLEMNSYFVQVQRTGYVTTTWEVPVPADSFVEHELEIEPLETPMLAPVVVEAVAPEDRTWYLGFERRRVAGEGQFVTRDEIELRRAPSLGDLLRTLNGLQMFCNRRGCSIQMTRTRCRPEYFLDGFPADRTTVERMPVTDIFGVEVFNFFQVPVEFQRADLNCGVIAVWTRRGPPPR